MKSTSPNQVTACFTADDYAIVRAATRTLSPKGAYIVRLRFWQSLSLDEIADDLRMGMPSVEALLQASLVELRQRCLTDPKFSLRALLAA